MGGLAAIHGRGQVHATAQGTLACDVLDAWFPPSPAAILAGTDPSLFRQSPDLEFSQLANAIEAVRGVPQECLSFGARPCGFVGGGLGRAHCCARSSGAHSDRDGRGTWARPYSGELATGAVLESSDQGSVQFAPMKGCGHIAHHVIFKFRKNENNAHPYFQCENNGQGYAVQMNGLSSVSTRAPRIASSRYSGSVKQAWWKRGV